MPFRHADKLQHALVFSALAGVGMATAWFEPRRLLVTLAAYGALMELAQGLTPHRQADVLDWLADLAGTLLALAMARAFSRRRTA